MAKKRSAASSSDNKRSAASSSDKRAKMERALQQLQNKMNYLCEMNKRMQTGKDAEGDASSSALMRVKRYIDNNRAITAMFMLFLNIGSRYINLNITTSQEYYLRKMLVPELLIFCVSWMGSRDILIAAGITLTYSIMTRLFFNENSNFCIVKHKMKQIKQLIDTNDDQKISDRELENAIHVLSKAKDNGIANKRAGAKSAGGAERAAKSVGDVGDAEDAEDDTHNYNLDSPIVGGGNYGIDYNVGAGNEMTTFGNDPIFEPMMGGANTALASPSIAEPFTNLPSV